MTYEEAQELFYNNEEIQKQFDYWEIDRAFATIETLMSDLENIIKERAFTERVMDKGVMLCQK